MNFVYILVYACTEIFMLQKMQKQYNVMKETYLFFHLLFATRRKIQIINPTTQSYALQQISP